MAKDRKAPREFTPAPVAGEAPPRDLPLEEKAAAPSCAACRHFLSVMPEGNLGHCRRYPPSRSSGKFTTAGELFSFPVVASGNVCGEFAPAAAKP